MPFAEDAYQIADELRAVANLGLRFAVNDYDRERYQHILSLAARLIAALEGRAEDDVMAQFEDNMGHVSPTIGAEGVVFHEDRILLIRREDNGLWAIPGGLVEVGETLAESAARELREEAGVRGRVTRLLGVFDSRLWASRSKSHLYHFLFLVETDNPTPKAGPETTDARFFAEDELPPLSPGHDLRMPLVFKLHRGEIPAPYFDATGS
ncbi:MAG: NUDIX hydrolase N-terminal domain-containing protein [Chloroflexi bacterium]|nr:NUDIX hydrolase N-terminal domain-containing protein [Chloroflexota bacterium]